MSTEEEGLQPVWLSAERSIVEPSAFAREMEAEDAVLCFSEEVFACLIDAFGLDDGDDGPVFPGALEGKLDESVAVYLGYFGAPAAGMMVEAMIASGVRRFVMVGQAGSITSECRMGHVMAPTWGVREEGTSYHYLPPGAPCEPSPNLLRVVKRYLDGIELLEGGIWTIDAAFRETPDKVGRLASGGVLAVEMECTALMAIAAYRGVEFAAVVVITDQLFTGEWVHGFGTPEVRRSQALVCGRLAEGFLERGRFA